MSTKHILGNKALSAATAAALGAGLFSGVGSMLTAEPAAAAGCPGHVESLLYHAAGSTPSAVSGTAMTVYYDDDSNFKSASFTDANGSHAVSGVASTVALSPAQAMDTCGGSTKTDPAHEMALTFTPTGPGSLVLSVSDSDGDTDSYTWASISTPAGPPAPAATVTGTGSLNPATPTTQATPVATLTGANGGNLNTGGGTVQFYECTTGPAATAPADATCAATTANAFGAAVSAPASPSGNVSPSSPLSVVAPPAGQSTTYCFSWVYTPGTGSAYSMVNDNVASVDSALCFTISTPVDPPANNNTGGSSTTTGGGGGGSTTTTTGGGGGGGSTTTTGGGGGGSTTTTGGGGGGATKLTITRIGGADRIDTADLVSQANYANGAAGAVVLARSDLYPDSLAGTPLALGANAPILLTPPTSLDPRTAAEIQRVLPTGGTVYLLGQTSALSSDVENAVSQLGYNVVRIGGTDRFETAVDIAQALKQVSQVFVASGTNYPDALSAAAASTPTTAIVLTDGTSLPNVTNSFLGTNSSLPTWTIGGPAAQADPTPKSLVGADRYATSALVAQTFFNKPTGAGMATGLNFPDALTAGPFLARQGFPMLLTDPYTMPSSISTYLTGTQASLGQVDVFGGPAAVSNQLLSALTTLLGG